MIENGAEISRAEESLRRMLSSSGIKGNAFCLNSIVVLICSVFFKIMSVFLATGAFCIYFGGSIADALVSGIIGLIILKIPKSGVGVFAYALLQSTVAGILSYIPLFLGLAVSPDKIMIGTVMLLIPGITMGNAVRDVMYCDTLSGVIEFTESVFTALAIAFGFSLAVIFLGG